MTTSIHNPRGFVLATVVVFGSVFLTLGLALTGYLLSVQKAEELRINKEKALAIAEAGLDYYAWHLAHFPGDLQDGTGAAGPYVHSYEDPEGGVAGSFSLSIDGNLQCGEPTSIDISSTGATVENPTHTATVHGRYARESVASYSFILNSTVWAGSDRVIRGRYHSNNGIRMDGDNHSVVESSVADWTCTSAYGCSPSQQVDGVFGAGSTPALWSYPVPQIDFGSISINLAALKTAAQTAGGLYFGPASGAADQRGYRIVFNGDGTATVYQVTGTTAVWGYSSSSGWNIEHTVLSSQTASLGTFIIPPACSVLFFEDRVWVEGVVKGRVTVASADLTGGGTTPDVMLANNITYTTYDGSDGLTLVSSGNILIPLTSAEDLTLNGTFIAQNGHFGRNYYCRGAGCAHSVPSVYQNDILKDSLNTIGTIVSNGRTGTAWVNGSGTIISGYQSRTNSFDGNLATNPPPFTPYTTTQYDFVRWRQE